MLFRRNIAQFKQRMKVMAIIIIISHKNLPYLVIKELSKIFAKFFYPTTL